MAFVGANKPPTWPSPLKLMTGLLVVVTKPSILRVCRGGVKRIGDVC